MGFLVITISIENCTKPDNGYSAAKTSNADKRNPLEAPWNRIEEETVSNMVKLVSIPIS